MSGASRIERGTASRGRDVYLTQIRAALPRLVALFDEDSTGGSYGMGDRRHWAWALIDFANGTFQGAAGGLARLVAADLLPEPFTTAAAIRRIDAMFLAADRIRRRDGSLEEAFPYEGSYCVTALGAYDLLTAIELLGDRWDAERRRAMLAVVEPMIRFLERSDETHAIISNHLATAAAALVKWERLTGETVPRAAELLDRILRHQSQEGWYCEYGGADPGYQSLCTYYLADVLRMIGDERLEASLDASVRFVWHFAHPDGSFGGLYGSRNTRFYYPAGLEFLAGRFPEAAALAAEMRRSIAAERVVTLAAMDEPNLVPMFNAYCWAATLDAEASLASTLPCHSEPFRRHWPGAGLLVDRGASHYTIVGTRKGGVFYHFSGDRCSAIDGGLVCRDGRGRRFSTQNLAAAEDANVTGDEIVVRATFQPVKRRLPTPLQFIMLRLLNVTVMRSMAIRERVKQLIVRLLISGSAAGRGSNERRIRLGPVASAEDETELPDGCERVPAATPFTAIHMASIGYWQAQDER